MSIDKAKTLEVPYAFGKLSVHEVLDSNTNESSGIFSVTDKNSGFSFGLVNIADNQFLSESFQNVECDERKKIQSDNQMPSSVTGNQTKSGLNNMMKQKKENDYLVEQIAGPKSRSKSRIEITKIDKGIKRLDLKKSESKTDQDEMESERSNLKRQRTDLYDQLHAFKVCIANLNLPFSEMQWGSLNFYSGKNLIYTHYLWGDEPILVDRNTLLDIKVPTKFSGIGGPQYTVESLAEDFRYVLSDGFTLFKSSQKRTIEFQRVKSLNEETNNCYKIFNENTDIEVSSSNATYVIFDEKLIHSRLHQEVNSIESAFDFVKHLNVPIVLQNQFMKSMGIRMDRIKREGITQMPYYMVLKLHSGYDALNNYTTKMLNKYLSKKNSLLEQVYRIDPKLNLKNPGN